MLNKLQSYSRISALGPEGHCTSRLQRAVCISCGQGGAGSKTGFFCGRHKWMTSNAISKCPGHGWPLSKAESPLVLFVLQCECSNQLVIMSHRTTPCLEERLMLHRTAQHIVTSWLTHRKEQNTKVRSLTLNPLPWNLKLIHLSQNQKNWYQTG